MTRQNIILSRINARGALQQSTGVPDANKIIKTDSIGKLHPTLLPDDIEYYLAGERIVLPQQFKVLSFQDDELFLVQEIFDGLIPHTNYKSHANAQQLKLSFQIRTNDDNLIFKPTAFKIETKYSHNDPSNLSLTIQLYKNNSTLVQTDIVTPTLTWAEEGFARAEPGGNPVEFDTGDWATFILWIKGNLNQSIGIRHLTAFLTSGA